MEPGKGVFEIGRPGQLAGLLLFAWFLTNCFATDEPLYLDLKSAIEIALTNNPTVKIAESRIREAQALLMQAQSWLWPQLDFQTIYFRTDNPMQAFGSILNQRHFSQSLNFNDVPTVDNLSVKGIATYSIYAGGRIRAEREAAKSNLHGAEAEKNATRLQLAYEVTCAFYNVMRAGAYIEAAKAAVQAYESNLQVASNRFASGTLVRAELIDFEVRLAEAKEQLIKAQNAFSLSRRALVNLLGLDQSSAIEFDLNAPELPLPDEKTPINRPELKALRHYVDAADQNIRQARAGYYPRIGLFASVEHDRGWELDGDGSYWTAGIQMEWKLWDGFRTRSQIAQALSQAQQLREELRRVRLAIDLELAQAWANYRDATERVVVCRKALEHAQESVRLTRQRFIQGLALQTQLIDAESNLTAARVRLANAEADRRIAIAAIRKALGLPILPEVKQ